MKYIRNSLGILLIWIFLLYNIERINEPINLASFVYVLALLFCLALVFYRPLIRISFYWLFLLSMPPYFVLKWWYGHKLAGLNLTLTITEIFAIGLTIYLARLISRQLEEADETINSFIITPLTRGINPFDSSQNQIYREIRRARQHEQEVCLLALKVSEHSIQPNINRFIRELENEIIQSYINARVGKILVEKLHITDIISQCDDHFVILLPQAGKEYTSKIIQRLQSSIKDKLGLTLQIGEATFPVEATTFEELLEKAEEKMCQPSPESEQLPVTEESETKDVAKF